MQKYGICEKCIHFKIGSFSVCGSPAERMENGKTVYCPNFEKKEKPKRGK